MISRSLITLAILLSSQALTYAVKPIQLITEEWPPYNYVENKSLKGYSTEIIKLAMKELGINEKIDVFPSMRAKQILETSKRTIFFSFIKTPERTPLYKWIGPIGNQSIHFFKKKGSLLNIQTVEDAKKVNSICCRNGGLVFETLKKLEFNNLDTSSSAKSIYLKAISGRCDLAISETKIGYTYWMNILNQPLDSLIQTPVKITDNPLYFVATKDISDEEVSSWQEALEKVIASSSFQEIAKRYGQ